MCLRLVGLEACLRGNRLLPVVVHDSGVEALHLSLGASLVLVDYSLVERARAMYHGTDRNGTLRYVGILDFFILLEDLAPAGNAPRGADGRGRTP